MLAYVTRHLGKLIGIVALLGVASFFFFLIWHDLKRNADLVDFKEKGQWADAIITKSTADSSFHNGSFRYFVGLSYSLKVDGLEFPGEDERPISSQAYANYAMNPKRHWAYAEGESIPVFYHPEKPDLHRTKAISDQELAVNWPSLLFIGILGLIPLTIAVLLMYAVWCDVGDEGPAPAPGTVQDYVDNLGYKPHTKDKQDVIMGVLGGTFIGTIIILAIMGMRTQYGAPARPELPDWISIAGFVVGAAVAGAFGGELLAARLLKAPRFPKPSLADKEEFAGRWALIGGISFGTAAIVLVLLVAIIVVLCSISGMSPSPLGGSLCMALCGAAAGAVGGMCGGFTFISTRPDPKAEPNDYRIWFLVVEKLDSQGGDLTLSVLGDKLTLSPTDLQTIKKKLPCVVARGKHLEMWALKNALASKGISATVRDEYGNFAVLSPK